MVLFTSMVGAQEYDFKYKKWERQLIDNPFTEQQYITAASSLVAGAVISSWLTKQTGSRFVGIAGATIITGFVGLMVDRNDQRSLANYDLSNTPYAYNDALAASLGGFVGSVTIKINIGGRRNSKRGFNNRYSTKRRRRR